MLHPTPVGQCLAIDWAERLLRFTGKGAPVRGPCKPAAKKWILTSLLDKTTKEQSDCPHWWSTRKEEGQEPQSMQRCGDAKVTSVHSKA